MSDEQVDTDVTEENTDAEGDTSAEDTAEEKPEQTVTIEDSGPARKKLIIELPESRIKDAIGNSYEQLRDDAQIPGFRRGRAPKRLLEKRFGSSIKDDVRGQLLSESYTQAIEDNNLDVIGEPDVKDADKIELPDEGPLRFEVEIEVTPDFNLPNLESMDLEKPLIEVTDEQVDAEVKQLAERNGQMAPVTDGGIQVADYGEVEVHILAGKDAAIPADFKAPEEDEDNSDNPVLAHHPFTYILVHGEDKEFKGHVVGIVVEDLGKRMIDKKIGHKEVISMTGPEGHENERIKGQPITVHIHLKGIQRVAPATVESLLENFGLENETELKDEIRNSLEANRDRTQSQRMHEQICDYLAEKVDLELPEGLSGRQTARLLQRQGMELSYQGVSKDDIDAQLADMRSSSEEQARKELKLFFILDKASKELNIEVDDAELNGRIVQMAMQQQRRPEKVRQEMIHNGQFDQLYVSVRDQKTLDAIVEKANIKEVKDDSADADGEKKPTSKKKSTKKKSSKKKAAKKADAKDDDAKASDDGE